ELADRPARHLDRRGDRGHRRRAPVPHPDGVRPRAGAPGGRLARRAPRPGSGVMTRDATLRLEDFIQAVQSQLDNAQAAMAVKPRNLDLPLTFAIKDINLDLRAHVEFVDSEIRIRPAGAGEKEASVFHLVFTAITRPAIEENAISFSTDPDDQPLDELGNE